jgi:hypothetical protein
VVVRLSVDNDGCAIAIEERLTAAQTPAGRAEHQAHRAVRANREIRQITKVRSLRIVAPVLTVGGIPVIACGLERWLASADLMQMDRVLTLRQAGQSATERDDVFTIADRQHTDVAP